MAGTVTIGHFVKAGLFGSCVAVAACGGGAAAVSATPATPTAPEVTALKCRLGHSQSKQIDTALQSALVAAGYTVVTDRGGDASIELVPTITSKPTMFAIVVNGQKKMDWTVTVNAQAAGKDGQLIDQATAQFSDVEADVNAEELKPLVSSLNAHGKLASFARDSEANAWRDADANGCASPTSAKSCLKLEAWLAKHDGSPKADEARKILKDAEGKLAALEDDQAWNTAHPDQCKSPTQSSDCNGVQVYMNAHASGGHATEAKQLLQASSPKIAKLKSAESAAQKAQNLSDCRQDCKQNTCAWLMGFSRYNVCVANCVSACQ